MVVRHALRCGALLDTRPLVPGIKIRRAGPAFVQRPVQLSHVFTRHHSKRKGDVRDDKDGSPIRVMRAGTPTKRKGIRSPQAAFGAKRKRLANQKLPKAADEEVKSVIAYCVAEQYLIDRAAIALRRAGHELDPFQTALYPQVLHLQMPAASTARLGSTRELGTLQMGDVFIFPSGTIVSWDVEDSRIQSLIYGVLQAAAVNAHPDRTEFEDLDYFEDCSSEKSAVVGDTLRIGTKPTEKQSTGSEDVPKAKSDDHKGGSTLFEAIEEPLESHETDLTLAKLAFSSALARSTKVAVLESLLDSYFASTQRLPSLLSTGSRLPRQYNRRFILRKTGELLSVRAQLNLTELTDRTPDLFWDTRHELGLESYFEQAGRALDLNWRIKVLNERVDYAREIAEVLREELQGRHGELLEWLIIGLITVEVGFESWKLFKEWRMVETTEEMTRRYLKMKLGEEGE